MYISCNGLTAWRLETVTYNRPVKKQSVCYRSPWNHLYPIVSSESSSDRMCQGTRHSQGGLAVGAAVMTPNQAARVSPVTEIVDPGATVDFGFSENCP